MIGGSLGEIPTTGGKLGEKQSERIVKMVSKLWPMYSTIYQQICIRLRHPFIDVHLFVYLNSSTSPAKLHYALIVFNQGCMVCCTLVMKWPGKGYGDPSFDIQVWALGDREAGLGYLESEIL